LCKTHVSLLCPQFLGIFVRNGFTQLRTAIDGDELNNQESNLRVCDFRQNAANQKKAQNKSSLYKGVSKCGDGWRAQVTYDNRKVFDAVFPKERWAAMAADLNAVALFGEYARRNFPEAILVCSSG
jgi:hypothetical protein